MLVLLWGYQVFVFFVRNIFLLWGVYLLFARTGVTVMYYTTLHIGRSSCWAGLYK